jgi:teichuronic acid biosynthesis glycosyltransferase TuaG
MAQSDANIAPYFINGLISVILPTYNRYEFLLHAIRSCLNQTYPHVEVIVVDDASTDPRYKDGSLEKFPRTTIVHLPINQKKKYNIDAAQGMTRQEGLLIARGEWIAFLDDDDFFYPTKLEEQLAAMTKKQIGFCSSNMQRVHHRGITVDATDMEFRGLYFQPNALPEVLTKSVIKDTNYINNSTVIIHREFVQLVGPFRAIPYEDWDYWKRALEYTDCLYLNKPLTYYTVSADPAIRSKNYRYPDSQ